jgi:hypothetical protein
MFAGTPEGDAAIAAIYALIGTARASGLDVYQYLRYLFEKIPFARSDTYYRKLLPQELSAEKLAPPKNFSVVY